MLYYLNKYTTSPTYVLYYLNEKNQLTISYHIFFYLSIATFGKTPFQQSTSFPQATLSLWNLQSQNQGKPVFSKLSNCVTYLNAQTNPTFTVTELLSITLKSEPLKYYLAKYFVKTDIINLSEVFYRVLWSKYCICSKNWPELRH